MTRLNNKIRESIVNNAIIKSGVKDREDALIARRIKLAEDVRLFAIGGKDKEQEVLENFEKLKEYVEKHSNELIDVEINLDGRDWGVCCNFSGRAVDLPYNGGKGKSVYKDLCKSSYRNRVAITADNPLNDEFDAIELEQRTIKDLKSQVKGEVGAMVNSVTTIKKLIDLWPEVKELLPQEEKQKSTSLVANVENLNTMIGLPSGDD